jgi:hypothetical protein
MPIVELNAISGVGQYLGYETFELQEFFLWHVKVLSDGWSNVARVGRVHSAAELCRL